MSSSQLDLDLDGLASTPVTPAERHGTIDERFKSFHEKNPHVYGILVMLARRAKNKGRTRIGMKMLYEVARWHFYINARVEDEYVLNNDYTSRYARLINDNEPDLHGIFEMRRLRA